MEQGEINFYEAPQNKIIFYYLIHMITLQVIHQSVFERPSQVTDLNSDLLTKKDRDKLINDARDLIAVLKVVNKKKMWNYP